MRTPLLLALLLLGACQAQAPQAHADQTNGQASAPAPATNVSAPDADALPALTGRVVDNANLLTPQEETRLAASLEVLERRTSDQVVIVTTPSLGGRTIEAFGLALGNRWGIGQRDKDNGVLVILSVAEQKVRIEVGYGLEPILTNARAQAIIDQDMMPRLREGRWNAAFEAAASSITTLLVANENEPRRGRS